MTTVFAYKGKAREVFKYLKLMAKYRPEVKIGELKDVNKRRG